ncbi:hypothetical protein KY290_007864 [Solanum tuberosum]|uniref:Retrotransposon gag domain-containing protein n=1 Tax=Solanum tuberosum TaxID=4113 RepID=A0ABQ7W6S3_SOLTU|nr:hypothetical protein KY290_007864 [Solanum tuberosum]
MGLYRADIKEQSAENLSFREAGSLQIDGVMKDNDDLRTEIDKVLKEKEIIYAELSILRLAVTGSRTNREEFSKVKIPEPKAFGGTRSAKKLENFLWDMEQYFIAAHVRDDDRVSITTMYLADDAKLWWRTRMAEQVSTERPKIDSWELLKKELKAQFFPRNAGWIARDRLKTLRQTGSIKDYVKEFSSLILNINNMSEEDKLHNFLYGLQKWAHNKLRRQNTKDLPSAIAAADALADFRLGRDDAENSSVSSKSKGKDKVKDWKKKDPNVEEKVKEKEKQEVGSSKGKEKAKFDGCFICDGPHMARNCPKRAKIVNCLLAESEDVEPDEETVAYANPMSVLLAKKDVAVSQFISSRAMKQTGGGGLLDP